MELLREGFKRLAVIAVVYYGGFKKFSLFTKIFVIIGILFYELGKSTNLINFYLFYFREGFSKN
jgi:hypothetical protein